MREIKFRAWDEKTKQMVYNIHTLYDGGIDDNELSCIGIYDTDIPTSSFGDVLSAKIPVMQFTGLQDKNGKEIYEGDLVIHPTNGRFTDEENDIYIIEFRRGCFIVRKTKYPSFYQLFKSGRKYDSQKDIEIIGNIFENKDLIN